MITIDNSKICVEALFGRQVELLSETLVRKLLGYYLVEENYPNQKLLIDYLEFVIDSETEVRFFLIDSDTSDDDIALGGCTTEDGVIYAFLKGCAFTQASLIHELVHARQIIDKRLVTDKDGAYWEGQFFSRQQIEVCYPNLPWEKEAYDAQIKVTPINERKQITNYLKGQRK